MKIYYRISDNSYDKPKLPGTNKEVCFMNFVDAFSDVLFPEGENPETFKPPIRVIADRCKRTTNKMLMETGLPVTMSDKGNAGSLKLAIELALEENDDEIVYFVEDDYLHLPKSVLFLEEGLRHADYVTLYDHPDKYTKFYGGGETSKVIKTVSSHWRYTISTCMTFATKVGTLREDKEIWDDTPGNIERGFGAPDHPDDHRLFECLKDKGRTLAVPIPGAACHIDLTFSGGVNVMLIEPWAIEMMCNKLWHDAQVLIDEKPEEDRKYLMESLEAMIAGKTGWKYLIATDVFMLNNK